MRELPPVACSESEPTRSRPSTATSAPGAARQDTDCSSAGPACPASRLVPPSVLEITTPRITTATAAAIVPANSFRRWRRRYSSRAFSAATRRALSSSRLILARGHGRTPIGRDDPYAQIDGSPTPHLRVGTDVAGLSWPSLSKAASRWPARTLLAWSLRSSRARRLTASTSVRSSCTLMGSRTCAPSWPRSLSHVSSGGETAVIRGCRRRSRCGHSLRDWSAGASTS
jgi:hypothetical protein